MIVHAGTNNMVARRLAHLVGKVELDGVERILDVGSRDLGQSIEFSSLFPNAKIDAFEPVPDSYQFCIERLNRLQNKAGTNIRVHNIALNKEKGEIPFFAIDASKSSVPNVGASSMFRFMDGLNGTPFGQHLVQREIKVAADTLDSWSKENNVNAVDILWMDVQGAELHVLEGASELLDRTSIIMTEVGIKPYYEGHTLKEDIDRFLASKGFRELEGAFEINGFEYEANTIYIKN